MAQSYHHTILPLANPRDRRTEIRWGIRSFELLFGRQPLGIWLPETAVDTATLEDCLAEGLRFTVLAPSQVGVAGTPNGAYRLPLGGDRSFEAIVYDGGLGGLVSFDPQATTWADQFAATHVAPRFDYIQERPALVAIATDGEVYGHHHKFKDYFVQDLLSNRLSAVGITPVTAEQYVVQHPANRLAVLHERSSWGCPHHLARWSTGCSCTEGSADWKQALRDAFDHLATQIDTLFERVGCLHLHDPWAARDAYIDVVDGAVAFDEWYGNWNPGAGDRATAHLLLEAQRHRLAMYASCAFYWEDVDRLEPGYGIQRGLTAAGMLDGAFDTMFAAGFRRHLTHAIGWRSHQSAAELHAAG